MVRVGLLALLLGRPCHPDLWEVVPALSPPLPQLLVGALPGRRQNYCLVAI